ncbi:hypothetical protein K431DRAFT_254447, partial [Polychaeton citri CBS 116435]
MAKLIPSMPFLRPMGLPRPQTVRHFLRFSTTTSCSGQSQAVKSLQEDPNLVASRTAPDTYPPRSLKSLPRPKESKASHRTAHPRVDRRYPTRNPTHNQIAPQKLLPEPVQFLPEQQCAPNLSYFVTRTPSRELPIYNLRKRGGNMLLTRVKKIDGDVEALKDELRSVLSLGEKEAVVNKLTRHVVLRGHHKVAVEKFLRERKF